MFISRITGSVDDHRIGKACSELLLENPSSYIYTYTHANELK